MLLMEERFLTHAKALAGLMLLMDRQEHQTLHDTFEAFARSGKFSEIILV